MIAWEKTTKNLLKRHFLPGLGASLTTAWLLLLPTLAFAAGKGEFELRAIDKDTGKPIAVRVHLKDPKGKAVKPPKVPGGKDYFILEGNIVLKLSEGTYTFEAERGPEYKIRSGHFIIEKKATDNNEIVMERFIDMAKEGWWSGDTHVHGTPADIEPIMLAEDLHVAPVITWWNNTNYWEEKKKPLPEKKQVTFGDQRMYHLLAGEDEREGGSLMYFNLDEPLPIAEAKREYPSPMKYLLAAAEKPGSHISIEKPFWWDTPIWAASGKIDSIGILHNHMQRESVIGDEAWGKPRDKFLYPGEQGNGRWTQEIYYQLLNSGLRIAPTGGSGTGLLPNPAGYNRVYVYCGKELTWDSWWQNLKLGRVVVTNGPLLLPRVKSNVNDSQANPEGELPGHIFQADAGKTVELNVSLNLSTRDKIDYLEIVKDGKPIEEVRLDKWAAAGGKLPPIKFDQSGWLMIRAVTNNTKTYRMACTGPYYVEIGYKPRVSKASAQFFLDWVVERAKRLKLDTPEEKAEVLAFHRTARDFWQKKVDEANAE